MIGFVFLSFFMIGAIFGSFYYVVAYRMPKGESIVYPPSHCPNCNHRLGSLELIPIFSYLLQGGKCKWCKNKISFFYPLYEIVCGLLFGFCFIAYGFSYELVIGIIFISMIIIIMLSDYYYMIIPDEILLFFSIVIIFFMFLFYGWFYTLMHIIYGVISFVIMYLIKIFGDFLFKKESMGGGDIKLMFTFGLMFGWQMSIVSIFIASVIGLPISLILLKKNNDHILPFGPYLGIAAILIVLLKIDVNFVLSLLLK